MNEGEEAAYTFNFLPTLPLDSSKQLVFTFPTEYDQKLGSNIQCQI
jgi:hypothetical protein